jgi:hypothetical protein
MIRAKGIPPPAARYFNLAGSRREMDKKNSGFELFGKLGTSGSSFAKLMGLDDDSKLSRLSDLAPDTNSFLKFASLQDTQLRSSTQPVMTLKDAALESREPPTAPIRRKRGRPRSFSESQLKEAYALWIAGKSNNAVAKILHGTKTPTDGQRRNVSKTMKHHFGSKK